jgi:hypothetical protein
LTVIVQQFGSAEIVIKVRLLRKKADPALDLGIVKVFAQNPG